MNTRAPFLALCCALALSSGVAADAEDESFRLSSDAFTDGGTIPTDNTCDGADRSPPLHWDGAPADAKAFALIVEDPDAPGGTFTHWLLYNVPGGAKSLTAGMPTTATLGDGSRQGLNDFRRPGYGGPCPPKGSTHRYEFTLYALGHPLDVDAAAGAAEVEKAIKQSKIAAARLAGRYSRQ